MIKINGRRVKEDIKELVNTYIKQLYLKRCVF